MTSPATSLLRRLAGHSFIRGVFAIGSAGAIGQLASLLAMPLLSRLFTPDDYGVFGLFSAAAAALLSCSALRYEFAVPTAGDDDDAAHLMVLAFGLLGVTVALLALATATGLLPAGLELLSQGGIAPLAWMLPLAVLAGGVTQIAEVWHVRQRRYGPVARARMSSSFTNLGVVIPMGLLQAGAPGLIAGTIVSPLLALAILVRAARHEWVALRPRLTRHRIRAVAREFYQFPLFNGPSALLNVLGANTVVITALTALHGSAVVGVFLMTRRLISAPLSMVAQATVNVFWGQSAVLAREDPRGLRVLFLRVSGTLALLLLPVLAVGLLPGDLFVMLLGERWRTVTTLVGWVALDAYASTIVSSVALLTTLRLNHWQFGWDAVRLAIIGAAFLLANAWALGPIDTVALLSLASVLSHLLWYGLMLLAVRQLVNFRMTTAEVVDGSL